MKTKIKCVFNEFICSLMVYSLLLSVMPNSALSQSDTMANQVGANWEGQYAELDYMVSTSEVPKREVQKQLTLSQYFAYAGLLAVPMCSNFSLIDIDIWAAGSAYFMTHSIILRNKEKKIVEDIARIQQSRATAPEVLNSESQKKHRDEQVESMEQILNAQKEAIKLIKEKTAMLQAMVAIYSAAAIALGIMLIKPDGGLVSAKCQNTKGKDMSKVELIMLQIREHISKGFSLLNILPNMVQGVMQKATSSSSIRIKDSKNIAYSVELEKNKEILNLLTNKFKLILQSLSGLIIENSYAQDNGTILNSGEVTDQGKNAEIERMKIDVDNKKKTYMKAREEVKNTKEGELEGKKKAEKTAKNELDTAETDLAKESVNGGENLLGKTLYFPYTRLGLYVAAGILTQISVDRNRKDIRVYEEKIAKFEKDLQDLKGATSKNLIEDAKEDDKNKNVNIATNAYQNNFGCLKTRGENYEYDATCECAKTNSCTSFSQQIPQDARPEYKSLVNDVDGLFNGKLNVNDQKTLDALTSRSLAAMNSIGNDVNLSRSANDKNAKPIDFKKDAVNMIKFASGKTMANLASNTSSSVLSGSKQSKNSVAEYSGFTLPSSSTDNSKGQIDLNKENQDMDLDLGDIHAQAEDSVFDVISIRYKKTVLPRLGNNIISTR